MRCVDCLIDDPDFLQDDGHCPVCGKPLGPRVAQEDPVPFTQQESGPEAVSACRLCGAPAGPDGGFCTACELMVLGELDVPAPVARADVEPRADAPPLELESWWVPTLPVAVAPPQEPPHEEPPHHEQEPRAEAAPQDTGSATVAVPLDEAAGPEPLLESWLVPPPTDPITPQPCDVREGDVSPAPWWAPTTAAADPPALPPQRPAASEQEEVGALTAPVEPARPAAPGGPTPGRVVRPSYSASTRPVVRGPAPRTPARRQLQTRRQIQTAAIRQPFLVAALLAITAGASYATREWMAGRMSAGDPSPIQATPVYASAMTASPFAAVMAPPPAAQPPRAEAPAATPAPAPPVLQAPTVSKVTATAKTTTTEKTARKTPPPSRTPAPVKNEVRTASIAPPVAAMTAPPAAKMATPPADAAPPREADPVPEPLPKSQTFEVSQVDIRPEVASRTEPSYPAGARERGLEDVVVVRVLVSPSGRAADTQILRRSKLDAAFDSAALSAVRQWTFTPARKRDRVVSCWMSVGIPFRMARAEGSQ